MFITLSFSQSSSVNICLGIGCLFLVEKINYGATTLEIQEEVVKRQQTLILSILYEFRCNYSEYFLTLKSKI